LAAVTSGGAADADEDDDDNLSISSEDSDADADEETPAARKARERRELTDRLAAEYQAEQAAAATDEGCLMCGS
jgi:hypothetical protein